MVDVKVEGITQVFFAGSAGVVIVEAAKIASLLMGKNSDKRMKRYRKMTYWIGFLILLLISGFVTVMTIGIGSIEFIVALQIGLNAPAIVTSWATASERDTIKKDKGKGISMGVGPTHTQKNVVDRTWFRQVLEDQAW